MFYPPTRYEEVVMASHSVDQEEHHFYLVTFTNSASCDRIVLIHLFQLSLAEALYYHAFHLRIAGITPTCFLSLL